MSLPGAYSRSEAAPATARASIWRTSALECDLPRRGPRSNRGGMRKADRGEVLAHRQLRDERRKVHDENVEGYFRDGTSKGSCAGTLGGVWAESGGAVAGSGHVSRVWSDRAYHDANRGTAHDESAGGFANQRRVSFESRPAKRRGPTHTESRGLKSLRGWRPVRPAQTNTGHSNQKHVQNKATSCWRLREAGPSQAELPGKRPVLDRALEAETASRATGA